MVRHRDTTRLRYVEPFRAELQRLGRPVFGPSFEVDVDTDLCILNRTLDGCTVPYESLSGGAKEQLGILARLAGAALVAKEDAVPILIDDALGFTDPERLAKMAEVFDTLGEHGQVIVLTCTPARYDGVKGAQRIESVRLTILAVSRDRASPRAQPASSQPRRIETELGDLWPKDSEVTRQGGHQRSQIATHGKGVVPRYQGYQ